MVWQFIWKGGNLVAASEAIGQVSNLVYDDGEKIWNVDIWQIKNILTTK